MEFTYGKGTFIESNTAIEGTLILSENKLFLKGPEGDLTRTYVPLEKIERIRQHGEEVYLDVRLSVANQHRVCFKGRKEKIAELIRDIVRERGLKKVFLKKEWIESND